jgi:hypothetical protein
MGKVLHASKSGYFPRCLVETPALPRDDNYIIGGIAEVMTPFWRVRKWEISVTGDFNQGESTQWNFNGTANEMFGNPVVEKEEDLVCFNSQDKFFIQFASGYVPWGTYTIAGGQGEPPITEPLILPAFLYVGLGYPFGPYDTFEANSIVKNDDVYKLPFFWGIQNFSLVSDSLGEGSGYIAVGTYTFDVLGVSTTPRTLYGPSDRSGSATAIVSAKEYWAYDKTYNTSTGQFL